MEEESKERYITKHNLSPFLSLLDSVSNIMDHKEEIENRKGKVLWQNKPILYLGHESLKGCFQNDNGCQEQQQRDILPLPLIPFQAAKMCGWKELLEIFFHILSKNMWSLKASLDILPLLQTSLLLAHIPFLFMHLFQAEYTDFQFISLQLYLSFRHHLGCYCNRISRLLEGSILNI